MKISSDIIMAGINSDRLKLALEPEAAVVCCEALEHTLTGQKFMVVDIGGGTADISVHEKQTDGSLKNIYALVGVLGELDGFAESPYVQQSIHKALPNKRLIVPGEAGLAVLKGAVMFGHKPDITSSRVMDYTYGIREWIIKNVFEVFVRVNEDVPVDSKVERLTTPHSKSSRIPIYRTRVRDPVFTTDPGCELIVTVEILRNFKQSDIQGIRQGPGLHKISRMLKHKTAFMFEDTKLLIKQTNTKPGKEHTLTLDLNT
ncbi:hypothetical protein DPMN_135041 [Dreissena polymorpha]|uniref:Uncharacterized protein n=1 Tax=Dreissena polymorpha TaxID=45954 RepID=A0A9D4G362_DREPO|nr:hypothetical protein DPMN_135041 [Dreissena polymorpha]